MGGEELSLAADPTPPIHQPGDYFQHPLQNVKASLSRRRVHHLLSKTFPRVSIKTHKHIMCHYFLLPALPFCQWRATRVSECSWVGCVLCKREALFENYRMWQDAFSVPEITLYGQWWGMCQISCLIGSETLKEMTLPQLPSLSLGQRESSVLPLLLHLLISVCHWSNLYLSVFGALLCSVSWGNWNWMPAKLQQTANGAWDTPWSPRWPDSLACKKLFLMKSD